MAAGNDSIIERIKKVLALAKRGGTPAEAETAMAKCQELLAAHNLSMSEIEEHGVEDAVTKETFEVTGTKRQNWKWWILAGCARLCFCEALFLNGTTKVSFIGKPVDIIVAKNLALYVMETCTKLAVSRFEYREERSAFRVGFASRIQQRCEMLVQQRTVREESTGRDLIVHPLYDKAAQENAKFIEENFTSIEEPRDPKINVLSTEAFLDGAFEADKIELATKAIGG